MLFVANLGFHVDDDALRDLFIEADINVVSARVVRWRWGHPRKSKGYGFVDVGSEEEQAKGIAALHDKEIIVVPLLSKLLSMRPRRMKPRNLATGLPPPSPLSDYYDPIPESSLLTTTPIFTLPFMFELSSGV
jgi:RNA recognition motif-containing protein